MPPRAVTKALELHVPSSSRGWSALFHNGPSGSLALDFETIKIPAVASYREKVGR